MRTQQTILAVQPEIENSLDVVFQEAVTLDIDVPVFLVQYSREELDKYVKEVSKPDINQFAEIKKTEISNQSEQEVIKTQTLLNNYVEDDIKANIKNYSDKLNNDFNVEVEDKLKQITSLSQSALDSKNQSEQTLVQVNSLSEEAHHSATQSQNWAIGDINILPQGSAKYWAEKINPFNLMQPGIIIMTPLSSIQGYLICNGAAISRNTYKALYSLLGTTYGAGDGSTTFNLPDFRGHFIQGYLPNYSRRIGESQYEGLPNITGGPFVSSIEVGKQISKSWGAVHLDSKFLSDGLSWGGDTFEKCGNFDASKSNVIYGRSGHVTPKNHALNFLIKY